ncbi:MAG: hypothetical protein ACMXYG_06795 [Candidatus Woesearchaeota archaeon]
MENIDIDAVFEKLLAKGLSYSEILEVLHKDEGICIPISALNDRRLGMLEASVIYLKERKRMNYREIGILLNRDERTIWTSYNKGKKKLRENENSYKYES